MWQTVAVVTVLLGVCVHSGLVTPPPPPPPPTPLEGNSWALLVAGSNGYYNYRHQADICHSYHVMINEGIPAERIVVMMYDDIAYNTDNPTPGVIINKPNGTNVYAGVKIDYSGQDLTPENFLNILSGNKKAMEGIGTGRVIKSTAQTNIFVYFADHGGTGMLCFPNSNLMADDLERTITQMHKLKKYNKFIFYVEACESGSMFDNIIPENIGVYVMTAAARDESSYGWYCEDGNCLGDEFSITWMEHMDSEKTGTREKFFHQFQHVRSRVTKSHVQIYGDYSIGPDALTPNKQGPTYLPSEAGDIVSVSSREIALYYLKNKAANAVTSTEREKAQKILNQTVEARRMADQLFDEFVSAATINSHKLRSAITNERLTLEKYIFPCYKKLLRHFHMSCFGHENEYFIQHFYKFANMCLLNADITNLLREMPSLCSPYKTAITVSVL